MAFSANPPRATWSSRCSLVLKQRGGSANVTLSNVVIRFISAFSKSAHLPNVAPRKSATLLKTAATKSASAPKVAPPNSAARGNTKR